MSDYYTRRPATQADGSPSFRTAADAQAEQQVQPLIERAFACTLHPFGTLAPVDWYAQREGRLVAVLELKSRSHATGEYPTVFLNVRKWLAMSLASAGLGVPAIFVVKFTDAVRWIDLGQVDATAHAITGLRYRLKSINDREPCILVPVAAMRALLPKESA